LGHSTVLLKINGYVILTDPILSDRAGMNSRVCTVGIPAARHQPSRLTACRAPT
jgi:L-ascorbate metabolism protein UlaG (beta-lactamase superfamily)